MNKKILNSPDLTKLKNLVKDYVTYCSSDEYHEDNDYGHYIFEEAVTAFYGEEIWDLINQNK